MRFLRRTLALFASSTVLTTLTISGTTGAADAVVPWRNTEYGPVSATTADALTIADLTATADRITQYVADHPDTKAPSAKWVRYRTQQTGHTMLTYFHAKNIGWCLTGLRADLSLPEDQGFWTGTDVDGIQSGTGQDVLDYGGGCSQVLATTHTRGIVASLKSDLKAAAVAVETYYTNHPLGVPTLTTLHKQGFEETPGNTLEVWAFDGGTYCLRATNPDVVLPDGEGYWWDSMLDGLQQTTIQPAGGACEAVFVPTHQNRTTTMHRTPADAGTTNIAGGVPGIITGLELTSLLTADMTATHQQVDTYRDSHDGQRPNRRWANARTQQTGINTVTYLTVRHGTGYCLTGTTKHGLANTLWYGTGMTGIKAASIREMAKTRNACGQVLRQYGYGPDRPAHRNKALAVLR